MAGGGGGGAAAGAAGGGGAFLTGITIAKGVPKRFKTTPKKWAGLKKMAGTQHKYKAAEVFYINFFIIQRNLY